MATWKELAKPIYVAHRGGANLRPQNTLPGFRDAYRSGLRVFETDVRVSSDGVGFIIHDGTVDAVTTSTGNVADLTAAELDALVVDSSSWYSSLWPDTVLPRLDDLLDEFGESVYWILEAKDNNGSGQVITDACAAAGLKDTILVHSFFEDELEVPAAAGPDTQWVVNDAPSMTDLLAKDYDWLAIDDQSGSGTYSDTDHQTLMSAGFRLMLWTVDNRNRAQELVAPGATGIISNDPFKVGAKCS